MQETKRHADYVRKQKLTGNIRNGSGHSGENSTVAIHRYKYLHWGYCPALLEGGREDIFL